MWSLVLHDLSECNFPTRSKDEDSKVHVRGMVDRDTILSSSLVPLPYTYLCLFGARSSPGLER